MYEDFVKPTQTLTHSSIVIIVGRLMSVRELLLSGNNTSFSPSWVFPPTTPALWVLPVRSYISIDTRKTSRSKPVSRLTYKRRPRIFFIFYSISLMYTLHSLQSIAFCGQNERRDRAMKKGNKNLIFVARLILKVMMMAVSIARLQANPWLSISSRAQKTRTSVYIR